MPWLLSIPGDEELWERVNANTIDFLLYIYSDSASELFFMSRYQMSQKKVSTYDGFRGVEQTFFYTNNYVLYIIYHE